MRDDFSKFYSVTDEKFNSDEFNKKVKKNDQLQTKGIEVGHIFYFGDKYSKPMNCAVDGKDGKKIFVKMGSYGIGVSRLVAAIIEAKFNNNKMKWPKAVENISNKFKKHDLLGIPYQIVVGSKSTKDQFEFKEVGEDAQSLEINQIINILKK